MALIKKQLLAKEDMLLSADNTPISQARAGTVVTVHPINASVIPFDETKSIVEAVEDLAYTHPSKHPVSIIDGSSNPSKFVKTDTLGNTGFDNVTWAEIEGKPGTYTPSSHEHSLDEVTSGTLPASRIATSETRQFITAEQASQLLDMEVKSNKGMPNGYAPLDSNGKINPSFLSALNLVEVFTPTDLASMLALTSAQPGDIAYRQDNSTSYMLVALPASTEANWKSLNTGSQIISVNGQTGVVSLNTSNIAESTNLYFTNERVDDRVANLLQAGTNISLAYDDTSNTLTINANVTKTQVGLGNVDNTSDINKPISTATQNALDLKAPLASPALTGTPTAPTATVGDSSTQLATTAFVNAEIADYTYSKTEIDTKLAAQNDASEISITPSGNLASTNVQTALEELQGDIDIRYTKTETDTLLANKAADSSVVHKTGNETIAGIKSFSDGVKVQNQNVSPFSGFKNYIINGRKTINQRGTTSTDNSYNHDRWYKAGNNWFQGIEGDSNLINGKTYTLSWAGVATASYYVGTATSATINAQSFTSIANGGSFTLTISGGQNLWIKFSSDATGSTFNFVQLEEGSVATPFENRPYGLELSLCQRYYETGITLVDTPAYQGGIAVGSPTYFKVSKRITPSIVLGTPSENVNITSVTAYLLGITMFRLTGTSVGSGNLYYTNTFTASAEL